MDNMQPLVSIMIPNYNHSRFLADCIKSAINQTYENLEIVILDNDSNDESMSVAKEFLFDSRVTICRNQINIMNYSYRILSENLTTGKYIILLCADDIIYPSFIEKAVRILEDYPNIGYVHGEKDIMHEDGSVEYWDPFYKCSFIANGRNTMPIYMMTPVAHPTQGVIRREAFFSMGGYDQEIDFMNADRNLWFFLSYEWDAAYIRDKCCGVRLGNQTETALTIKNAQHLILSHLMILEFVEFAKEKNLPEVYNRKEEALVRLADEFVVYAADIVKIGDIEKARAYLEYAKIVDRTITERRLYKELLKMCYEKNLDIGRLSEITRVDKNKRRGYEPPIGYIQIDVC